MSDMELKKQEMGSLFMIGLPGPDLDDSTQRLIREYHINNFIIFKRNVVEPGQLRSLCDKLVCACLNVGIPAPLISIDQEGGTVARLPEPFCQFRGARELADSDNPDREVMKYARTCAQELLDVGINMNFAPVLDVCPADKGYFMEHRSFGDDPERVAELGRLVIQEMESIGVVSCGKHFPGLGAAIFDPHEELPVVAESMDRIRARDLVPFKAAISAGVASIMTSHTLYLNLDSKELATMSGRIVTDFLRIELGYNGLIVTDDLEMGAITQQGTIPHAALKAFCAGVDLLLICHNHDEVEASVSALGNGLDNGLISPERVSDSIARLTAVRKRFKV